LPLRLTDEDVVVLRRIARNGALSWNQVRRARIVLAVAAGEFVASIAARLECAPETVRRAWRTFTATGVRGLLDDAPARRVVIFRRSYISPDARQRLGRAAAAANRKRADEAYAAFYPLVTRLRSEGRSLRQIADHLNALGHRTRRDKAWNPVQVLLVLRRAARLAAR
jgi:hypothetical protein